MDTLGLHTDTTARDSRIASNSPRLSGEADPSESPEENSPSTRTQGQQLDRLLGTITSKANALQIFRAIASGHRRPIETLRATKLSDMQIHRVLRWALTSGLVHRWGTAAFVQYRLTARAQAALAALDEPAWLPTAAVLAKLAAEIRLLGRDSDVAQEVEQEAVTLTGLSVEQTRRSIEAFIAAADPVAASQLAKELGLLHSVSRKLVFVPRLFPGVPQAGAVASRLDVQNEMLVVRVLERAGIVENRIEEATRFSEFAFGPDGPMDSGFPIISMSMTANLTMELLSKFNWPIVVDAEGLTIRWLEDDHEQTVPLRSENGQQTGIIARLLDAETGVSHFLITGTNSHGTHVACRLFHDSIEDFLRRYPGSSFGVVATIMDTNIQPATVRTGTISTAASPLQEPRSVSGAPDLQMVEMGHRANTLLLPERRRGDRRRPEPEISIVRV